MSAATPPIIAVIGSLNTDLITRTSRIPRAGETLTSQGFSTGSGGKGANQAVAAARLSRPRASPGNADNELQVRMVGAVGDDIFGHDLLAGLKRDGIDVTGVRVRSESSTGVACIIVEEATGENRILMSPNANYTLTPEDFTSLPLPLPTLLVLQLEIPLPTVLQILRTAEKQNVPVLLNPAPAVELPPEAYPQISYLVVNETEAAILSSKDESYINDHSNLPTAAKAFLQRGVKAVVITLGSKGAYFATADGQEGYVESVKAKAVDTTSAGDCWIGAFAVEIARHGANTFSIGKAIKWANAAAAKSVERRGAQSSIPWLDEVPRPK